MVSKLKTAASNLHGETSLRTIWKNNNFEIQRFQQQKPQHYFCQAIPGTSFKLEVQLKSIGSFCPENIFDFTLSSFQNSAQLWLV